MRPKTSNKSNHKNLAGEFYALSKLLLEGYDATLTLGNTKGVDILVYNPKTDKQFLVEVKTSTNGVNKKSRIWGKSFYHWHPLKFNKEQFRKKNLIFGFVNFDKKENNKASLWFVPSKEVKNYIKWENPFWIKGEHRKKINNNERRTFRIYINENKERDSKNREIRKIKSSDYDNFSLFNAR